MPIVKCKYMEYSKLLNKKNKKINRKYERKVMIKDFVKSTKYLTILIRNNK